MRAMRAVKAIWLVGMLGVGRVTAQSGSEPPSVVASRIPSDAPSIKMDGLLTEPIWQVAPAAAGFRQREPDMGSAASETTTFQVAYDATTLYIAVSAQDRSPQRIVHRILQRDRLLRSPEFRIGIDYAGDDVVAIQLDPFHDHRSAFVFATNANGAEFEALLTDEGREFNIDWRGIWEVASSRQGDGWTAEFAIPFRSLRYPSGGDGVWGINVVRYIARKREETLWSGWSRNEGGFHRVSQSGHVTGLHGLPRLGVNLEAKPYLLAGYRRDVDDDLVADTRGTVEAGMDLKWEVSPGLLLDVTANTDFAQVEADDEQVNLTRFSLFFPEKREFFLENAGIFEFGNRGDSFEPPPFLLFFSRTIGVHEDGEVPIIGGARLTGRTGGQTVGVLNVVTDEAFDQPRTNNAVIRVKRDVGGTGYLGGMLTDRRSSEAWNLAGGLDWSFWPSPTANVQGFVAGTSTSDGEGDGVAGRAAFTWERDRIGLTTSYLYISPDATADLGFITRTDISRADVLLRLSPRPRGLGLRVIDVYTWGQTTTDTDGHLLDWQAGMSVGPKWQSGEGVSVYYAPGRTTIDESFDIEDRVDVPEGQYDSYLLGWFARTSATRNVVLEFDGSINGNYGGTTKSVEGKVSLAPSPNLALSLGYKRNEVDLPGGAFSADIGTLRLTGAASTRLVANALVQYNSLDNRITSNLRIAYTFRPGSDLFLVYNEQRGNETGLWVKGDRAALIKLTWLTRF